VESSKRHFFHESIPSNIGHFFEAIQKAMVAVVNA
jgi:hypothetical protein